MLGSSRCGGPDGAVIGSLDGSIEQPRQFSTQQLSPCPEGAGQQCRPAWWLAGARLATAGDMGASAMQTSQIRNKRATVARYRSEGVWTTGLEVGGTRASTDKSIGHTTWAGVGRDARSLECATEALHHIALALHDCGGLRCVARRTVRSLDMQRPPIDQEGTESYGIGHERGLHL